jgi:hypothetical protein
MRGEQQQDIPRCGWPTPTGNSSYPELSPIARI